MPQSTTKNEIESVSIKNIGANGVIMENVIDESLMPAGAVNWAINCHFDRIGAVTTRDGITLLGAQVSSGNNIVGMFQFLDTGTGTDDRLIVVAGTVAYALVSGTWTSKRTTLTANKKARFTNFIDYVFMVNGAEAMQSWDGGAGNFSTNNVTNAPATKYIDNFRSRVWAVATVANPSRLFYSSVAAAGGTITWDTTNWYIDIAPGDGEDISGIQRFSGEEYIFKPNSVYRIFSINQTEPDAQINVGTYSQESIQVAKDGMYWHHPSGIYRLRKGETTPTEISRPINDIIKNISRTNYTEVSSWEDADHVMFYVGDITVYGITISNCVIRWTISTQTWTIYSYPVPLVIGASYDVSASLGRVVGDNDGNVYQFDTGNTDNTVAINYELETRWLSLTGLRSDTVSIGNIVGLHENLVGANVGWRSGNHNRLEIQPIGQLKEQETSFSNLEVKGNRIKLSIRGNTNSGSGIFQGFEIISWINEGVII